MQKKSELYKIICEKNMSPLKGENIGLLIKDYAVEFDKERLKQKIKLDYINVNKPENWINSLSKKSVEIQKRILNDIQSNPNLWNEISSFKKLDQSEKIMENYAIFSLEDKKYLLQKDIFSQNYMISSQSFWKLQKQAIRNIIENMQKLSIQTGVLTVSDWKPNWTMNPKELYLIIERSGKVQFFGDQKVINILNLTFKSR